MPERRKTIIAAGLLSAALCAASAGAAFAAGDADSAAQEKASLTAPAVATPEAVSAQKWMNEGKPSAEVDLKALAAEQAAKGREAAPAEFDPQANPRLYEVSRQLRCLVCANESIAESNAELAIDLRREVAAQIEAGRTNEEIIAFMTERYGDYVLYKPPFKAKTWILWLAPVAFVLLAGFAAWRVGTSRRGRRAGNADATVTDAQIDAARRILKGELKVADALAPAAVSTKEAE